MHLDRKAWRPRLVLENEGEVLFANKALGLAGYHPKEGESVSSSPIPMDGDFPTILSRKYSDQIVLVMDQVTESKRGAAKEALSQPVPEDLPFVIIARLAIEGTFIEHEQGE